MCIRDRYENVCVCVCGRNELEVCTTLAYPYSSFSAIHKHMHTRIFKQFEDSEPMGLKVDVAEVVCSFSYLYVFLLVLPTLVIR